MKITKIIIKGWRQFQDFELDLTYPTGHVREGEPLDQVCFIGQNGTGKSTILEFLFEHLKSGFNLPLRNYKECPFIALKITIGDKNLFYVNCLIGGSGNTSYSVYYLSENIEEIPDWPNKFFKNIYDNGFNPDINLKRYRLQYDKNWHFNNNSNDLLAYVPSESENNYYSKIQDVPETALAEALNIFNDYQFLHVISSDTIEEFWELLIYHQKKLENDFREYEAKLENQDKTVRQVREEFERNHPRILQSLAELWNNILGKAGLEFDYEGAKNPIQLTENLKAYIKLKSTGEPIPYNQLSTGIRNFIFKIGHLYSLYFGRKIERGFLLIDEPENSLFPDFLYDLMGIYQEIIQNTQMFVSTHNPIIAAQFDPSERFILEFDDKGTVTARRGITPKGDDPNDILRQDFGIRSILGKEGVEKWERFVELKLTIPKENDPVRKEEMINEYLEIGDKYNFDPEPIQS